MNVGKETELEFAMELRLRELNPELHRRFTDTVFALQHMLSHYQLIFPQYTDHTNLHSLSVIAFCNRLIGEQIVRLNADELYVLLMSAYGHDTGMGITMKDYQEFCRKIDFGSYFETHSRDDCAAVIREFHHEFSGCFLQKYAELLELPSREHKWAVIQVSRGHRRTNLMDEKEYPFAWPVPGGNTVCLPYLAALIRLADEIDVAAARNPILLYDLELLTESKQMLENRKLKAVRRLEISEKAFTLVVEPTGEDVREAIRSMMVKMQETLDTCRRAVLGRTPYVITQERVEMKEETA